MMSAEALIGCYKRRKRIETRRARAGAQSPCTLIRQKQREKPQPPRQAKLWRNLPHVSFAGGLDAESYIR